MDVNQVDAGRHRRRHGGSRRNKRILLIGAPIVVTALAATLILVPAIANGRNDTANGAEVATSGTAPLSEEPPSPASTTQHTPNTSTSIDGSTVSTAGLTSAGAPAGAADCSQPDGTLTIAASPDIAPTIREVAAQQNSVSCRVVVRDQDAAGFASAWMKHDDSDVDVWIPNSSVWSVQAARSGLPISAVNPTIASSAVVFALPGAEARRLDKSAGGLSTAGLLSTLAGPSPIRIAVPDPRMSVESAAALLEVRSAAATEEDADAALTWAVRGSPAGLPTSGPELLAQMARFQNLAVPVSEQAMWVYDQGHPAVQAFAVYPTASAEKLDYPYVVLGQHTGDHPATERFLQALRSSAAEKLLLKNGFRDRFDHLAAGQSQTLSGNAPISATLQTPNAAAVNATAHSVTVLAMPSKLLAVIDVSGSMAQQVPGGGGRTRLEYAQAAAIRGLSLYPPDSLIGLWTFSRNLTPTTDYREILPISPLTGGNSGADGQRRLQDALTSIQVNVDGGTGLYDTALAAVRTVRSQWSPGRVNAVLILSDGQNDDWGSISLDRLVATLQAEADPARPVPVIAIAFGPDSDVQAMSRISDVTGGATYVANDPQDIGRIFLDAVGHRLCRSHC